MKFSRKEKLKLINNKIEQAIDEKTRRHCFLFLNVKMQI